MKGPAIGRVGGAGAVRAWARAWAWAWVRARACLGVDADADCGLVKGKWADWCAGAVAGLNLNLRLRGTGARTPARKLRNHNGGCGIVPLPSPWPPLHGLRLLSDDAPPVGRPNRGLHAGRSLSRVRRLRLLHLRARPQLRALGAVSQICSATRIAACRIHLRLSCPFQAPCSRRLSVSRGAALPDSPKSHHSALLYASWLPLSNIPTAKVSFRPRSSPIPSDVGGGPAARYVECCSRCCYSFPVHTCNLPPPEPAVFALAIFVA